MRVKIADKSSLLKLSSGDIVAFDNSFVYIVSSVPFNNSNYELISLGDGARAFEEPMPIRELIVRILDYGVNDVQVFSKDEYVLTLSRV